MTGSITHHSTPKYPRDASARKPDMAFWNTKSKKYRKFLSLETILTFIYKTVGIVY